EKEFGEEANESFVTEICEEVFRRELGLVIVWFCIWLCARLGKFHEKSSHRQRCPYSHRELQRWSEVPLRHSLGQHCHSGSVNTSGNERSEERRVGKERRAGR